MNRNCIAQLLLIALAPILSLSAHAAPSPTAPGQFTVTCLQVADSTRGLGLALILQTPAGHTYLYDTGAGYPSATDPSGWVNDVNTARDQIFPFLQANHISAIDGVIISHAHLDHYGGLLWLVDRFPIKKLYDTGYRYLGPEPPNMDPTEESGYVRLRQHFKDRGAYQEVHAGDHIDLDPQLDVEVLAPPRGYFAEAHPEQRPANDPPAHYLLNANSTDIRIRHGGVVFLFPGDIQKEDQERSLLPFVPAAKLRADVLIAPGHGNNTALSPRFAAAVRPTVVIASLFPRFLPGNRAHQVYGAVGANVYITGEVGWIRVVSDGLHYTVATERLAPEQHGVSIPGLVQRFTAQGIH